MSLDLKVLYVLCRSAVALANRLEFTYHLQDLINDVEVMSLGLEKLVKLTARGIEIECWVPDQIIFCEVASHLLDVVG